MAGEEELTVVRCRVLPHHRDLNEVPESYEVRLLKGFLTEPAVADLQLGAALRPVTGAEQS